VVKLKSLSTVLRALGQIQKMTEQNRNTTMSLSRGLEGEKVAKSSRKHPVKLEL